MNVNEAVDNSKIIRLCLTPQLEGGYFARVAELPCANAKGKTIEEAVLQVCEALSAVIVCREEDDRQVEWEW